MLIRRRSLLVGAATGQLLPERAFANEFGSNYAPGWAKRGAAVDIDFKNGRSWGGAFPHPRGSISSPLYQDDIVLDETSYNTNFYYPTGSSGLLVNYTNYGSIVTDNWGLWADGVFVFQNLYSRNLTNAVWVATSMTTALNQVGADGVSNAATSITATAANATILQSITLASSAVYQSAYLKRLSGSGVVNMTMDGGTTWTPVAVTSTWTRFYIPTQTLANPSVGLRLVTSGDSVAVDFFNTNTGATGTPGGVQTTTSVTVTSQNKEPSFGSTSTRWNDGNRLVANLFQVNNPFSVYWEGSGNSIGTPGPFVSDAGYQLRGATNGGVAFLQGLQHITSVTSANSGIYGLGNINRIAAVACGGYAAICLNGGAIAVAAGNGLNSPSEASTHVGLGNNGSGAMALNGAIGRIALWNRELSQAEMINMTTGPNL